MSEVASLRFISKKNAEVLGEMLSSFWKDVSVLTHVGPRIEGAERGQKCRVLLSAYLLFHTRDAAHRSADHVCQPASKIF